ncbi:hypothetical protein J7L02_00545 [Candidatus Woesearchaeota archaeon]|nr:hypothetical protein [Candidatus Woesearchaeota archaeon]
MVESEVLELLKLEVLNKEHSFIAVTHKGLENACWQELLMIDEKAVKQELQGPGFFKFKTKLLNGLKIITLSKTLNDLLLFLGVIPVKSLQALKSDDKQEVSKALTDLLSHELIKKLYKKNVRFKITCKAISNPGKNSENAEALSIDSQELNKALGAIALKALKDLNASVDLTNPDLVFKALITDDKVLVGIDLAGFDLGNRFYKVFLHKADIKASFASCLLFESGFKGKGVLLDAFCKNGTIPIEAALISLKLSPRNEKILWQRFNIFKTHDNASQVLEFFRSQGLKSFDGKILGVDALLSNIVSSRRNAKIARVEKHVTFTRMDLEWLELKLGSESIDFFVSNIPRLDVQNLGELAYQLQALLKSEGKALLSMSFNDEYVEKAISLLSKRLVLKEKFVVWTGLKKYVITKWVKA